MVLPKVNYLFSMIPHQPPTQWFKTFTSCISTFLWNSKPPHISLKSLQKTKGAGWLELPHFNHYHIANRIEFILKWVNPSPHDIAWVTIERVFCGDTRLQDLPFVSTAIKLHSSMTIANTRCSLLAWMEFLKVTESPLIPCGRTKIWNNPDLLQNKKPSNFTHRIGKGITHLKHIWINNDFKSF